MYSAIDNIHFHFLYIDRYSFGRNWIFPETNTPYCMLRYIESGTATFHINNHEFAVKKDQIVYIPKGVPLSCYSTSSHFSFTSIRFTTSVFFEGGDLPTWEVNKELNLCLLNPAMSERRFGEYFSFGCNTI